jgi:hypothetical protein
MKKRDIYQLHNVNCFSKRARLIHFRSISNSITAGSSSFAYFGNFHTYTCTWDCNCTKVQFPLDWENSLDHHMGTGKAKKNEKEGIKKGEKKEHSKNNDRSLNSCEEQRLMGSALGGTDSTPALGSKDSTPASKASGNVSSLECTPLERNISAASLARRESTATVKARRKLDAATQPTQDDGTSGAAVQTAAEPVRADEYHNVDEVAVLHFKFMFEHQFRE